MGDAHFIEKAKTRMQRFVERSTILVLASHSKPLIERLCDKAVVLDQGGLILVGAVDEALTAYTQLRNRP